MDHWTRKADMPTARGLLCASVVDDKIFAIGAGGPSPFPVLSTVEMYDPLTDTWARKASMPTAREISSAVTAHGRIYVMVGRTPDTLFARVEEYDPVANTWTSRTNILSTNPLIPLPLYSYGGNEVNGRIYAIGGASGSDRQGLSQVLEYVPPVLAPSLKRNRTSGGLRLEWLSYPDYLDVLQSKRQLEADEWSEVERFSGTGEAPTREIPTVDAASLYRVQRTLK
jgi:hypothetical protein